MAIQFPESASDYYQYNAHSSIDFPNSDWCICMWEMTNDNSGFSHQYFVSTNTSATGANSLQILYQETGGSPSDCMDVYLYNSSGTGIAAVGVLRSSTLTFDNTPHLIVVQRKTNDLEVYRVAMGASASVLMSLAPASNWTAITAQQLELGRRADGNSTRMFGGVLGHVWIGEFSLSTAEITALASGQGISIFDLGRMPKFYAPLEEEVATQPNIISGAATGAENGTGLAKASIEFPVWTESPFYLRGVAAAGGGSINPNGVTSNWNGLSSYNWNGVS